MTIAITDIVNLDDISTQYNEEKVNLIVEIEMIDEIYVIKEVNFIPIKKVTAYVYKVTSDDDGNIADKSLLDTITKYFDKDGNLTTLNDQFINC